MQSGRHFVFFNADFLMSRVFCSDTNGCRRSTLNPPVKPLLQKRCVLMVFIESSELEKSYIYLFSALTPPLHVPCIRFAIICLTANIQPNFANGIHLVAKTKTTGKTKKKRKKPKQLKKQYFSIEYICLAKSKKNTEKNGKN